MLPHTCTCILATQMHAHSQFLTGIAVADSNRTNAPETLSLQGQRLYYPDETGETVEQTEEEGGAPRVRLHV